MTQLDDHVYAVIMAGGSGTRFWPVSRGASPKQLTRILGEQTMIQATVGRLAPAVPPERTLVITTQAIAEATRRQLPALPAANIIAEPVGRDTAACVCLAAEIVQCLDPEGVMILLPADQLIDPVDLFQQSLAAAVTVAQRERGLVTFGIPPRFAATGYGYIAEGALADPVGDIQVHTVARFVEKPNASTAEDYLAQGGFLWNSGIFAWRSDVVLAALRQHCPDLVAALDPIAAAWGTDRFDAELERIYQPLPKISVDYALMEKADTIHVVTAPFDWDDVGSWDAVCDHLPRDDQGVAVRGRALVRDARDVLVFNPDGPTVVVDGVDELIVVATGDAVLVCRKGASQNVKQIVDALREQGRDDLL